MLTFGIVGGNEWQTVLAPGVTTPHQGREEDQTRLRIAVRSPLRLVLSMHASTSKMRRWAAVAIFRQNQYFP